MIKRLFNTKNIALIVLIIISFGFIGFFYGDILMSPNEYMFNNEGDALKNYANLKYHIEHDESFTSYNGVFYPYGESIIFTDIHPLLATFYKLLSFIFPSIGYYTVGLINLQILLSFIVTSVVLFFIFVRLKTSEFTAVFGAFSITVLSSHILLLNFGHWALSYAWSIPLAWLLLMKFFDSDKKNKWSLLIGLNTLFWFLTHGYQGLSTLLLTASVFLMILITDFKDKKKLILYLKYFIIQVVLPLMVYYILVIGLDKHSSRINMPFVEEYASDINFVLTPNYSFLKPLFYFFNDFSLPNKSWGFIGNYIGITTTILMIFFVLRFKKYKSIYRSNNFNLYIPASIIILLYSFAIPFKYNLFFILDYIPAIKQFTSLGRFAWVFYFVITVFSFYFIDKIIKRKFIKYGLVFIVSFIMALEGSAYHSHISRTIKNPNLLKSENMFPVYKPLTKLNVDKYQAVITLPFFIDYGNPYSSTYEVRISTFMYSIVPLYTGLPSLNATLSRPALDEERKLFQIFSPNTYKKEIVDDLKSKKPFLVVHTKEKLPPQEKKFIDKCKVLLKTKSFDLYEINYNDIFEVQTKSIFDKFNNIKDSLIVQNNLYYTDSSLVIHIDYDEFVNDTSLFGTGVYTKHKLSNKPILELECNKFELGKKYNISFWYFNKEYDQAFTVLFFGEFNFYKNMYVNREKKSPLSSEIIYKNWNYVEFEFEVTDRANTFILSNFSDGSFTNNSIYIDNVLVREKTNNCYQEVGDSTLLINNMIYRLQ